MRICASGKEHFLMVCARARMPLSSTRFNAGQVPWLAHPIVQNALVLQVQSEPDEVKCGLIFQSDVATIEVVVEKKPDSR